MRLWRKRTTATVADLIQELTTIDPDRKVAYAYIHYKGRRAR